MVLTPVISKRSTGSEQRVQRSLLLILGAMIAFLFIVVKVTECALPDLNLGEEGSNRAFCQGLGTKEEQKEAHHNKFHLWTQFLKEKFWPGSCFFH